MNIEVVIQNKRKLAFSVEFPHSSKTEVVLVEGDGVDSRVARVIHNHMRLVFEVQFRVEWRKSLGEFEQSLVFDDIDLQIVIQTRHALQTQQVQIVVVVDRVIMEINERVIVMQNPLHVFPRIESDHLVQDSLPEVIGHSEAIPEILRVRDFVGVGIEAVHGQVHFQHPEELQRFRVPDGVDNVEVDFFKFVHHVDRHFIEEIFESSRIVTAVD